MNVLTLAGSPSLHSRSTLLLSDIANRLAQQGAAVQRVGLQDIPAVDLIESRFESDAIRHFQAQVAWADVFLVSTPVYKASFSGAVKTFLDVLDQRALAGKVVLPIATGGSVAHLLVLEYALKPVLAALGADQILGGVYATDKEVHIDEAGVIHIDEAIAERLEKAARRIAHIRGRATHGLGLDLGKLAHEGRISV